MTERATPQPPTKLHTEEDVAQLLEWVNTFPVNERFGSLLGKLIKLQDMEQKELSALTGYSRPEISRIISSKLPPYYGFIKELVGEKNPLRIPEALLVSKNAPLRVALFSNAHGFGERDKFGYVEVTPESTQTWNNDVLSSHQKLHDNNHAGPRPSFGDVMKKLLSHQCQDEEIAYEYIARESHIGEHRVNHILNNLAIPHPEERQGLYDFCKLTPLQQSYIEKSLPKNMSNEALILPEHQQVDCPGTIPIIVVQTKSTSFKKQLEKILDDLLHPGDGIQNIDQKKLWQISCEPCLKQPGTEDIGAARSISTWKKGRSISTGLLRRLVLTLDEFTENAKHNLETPKSLKSVDVDELILAATGESREHLFDDSKTILREGVAHNYSIKKILYDVLQSTDIWQTPERLAKRPMIDMELNEFDIDSAIYNNAVQERIPSAEVVTEILKRCDNIRQTSNLEKYNEGDTPNLINDVVDLVNVQQRPKAPTAEGASKDQVQSKVNNDVPSEGKRESRDDIRSWAKRVRAQEYFTLQQMHADRPQPTRGRGNY